MRGFTIRSRRRAVAAAMVRKVVLVCIVLLTVVVVAQGCADNLVLWANHESIDPGKARRKVIRVDGRDVECWIIRSPGATDREPQAFVLYFVGKGDRADRWIGAVANAWGERPVELWGMNYPGSGGSEGPPRLAAVGPDALATYDALKQVAGSRPIFVHAGSFGTTAALCVAARRPMDGLFLQNPAPLRQLILGYYGWWNLWLIAGPVAMQLPADLDAVENAAHSKAPAVFVMAGADQVIPPPYHRLVSDAYAGPKRIIDNPGARHDDPLTREAARQFHDGVDWIWQISKAGRF